MAEQTEGRATGAGRADGGGVAELLAGRPPMAGPLPVFVPDAAPPEPGPLFVDWLAEAVAAGVPDPQVVTVSTVDTDGLPDARVLVLRDVDTAGGGWVFAADADSPKGRQLAAHPVAALTVYWPQLGRQVRVRGAVETAPAEVAAAEFRGRSPASRVAGLVGRQSAPLDSLTAYEPAAAAARERLAADPEAVPPSHTVYVLRAREAEFWQGSGDRRHVRLRYTRTVPDTGPAAWLRTLLWP